MTPEQRLTDMIAERQKRKDEQDFSLSMSRREADAYTAATALLDARITHARNAFQTVAALLAKLAPELKWRDDQTTWREDFCKRLLGIDPDDHDRATEELRRGLRVSILNIDRGAGTWPNGVPMLGLPIAEAIRGAGYADPSNSRPGPAWLGSLPETEKRIKDLQKHIAQAQAALDNALLTDAERAKKDAEGAARVARINAMSNEDRAAAIAALDAERARVTS